MSASAQAEERAQRSDAEEMVIVVLGTELSTIDQSHGRLQTLMEGTGPLQRGRRVRESGDEVRTPLGELADDRRQRPSLVPQRHGLEARRLCRSVDLASLAKVVEAFLPEIFHIGEMPDILSDGPRSVRLSMRSVIVDACEQWPQARNKAPESFDEIGEHPRGMHERELALGPGEALETRSQVCVVLRRAASAGGTGRRGARSMGEP